jgi:SAM-dependent methyltransferase
MPADERTARHFVGGGLVLDIGCGDGRWLNEIGPRYRLAVGVDIALGNPSSAAGVVNGWRPVVSNLDCGIPVASDVADAIFANQVIEHVKNPLELIQDVYRVLRTGGVFVATTPNVRYVKHAFRLIIGGRGPMTSTARLRTRQVWDDGHIHYFTPSDLVWIARSAGFRDVHASGLIGLHGELSGIRGLLDRMAGQPVVRDFLSGNTKLIAVK